MATGIQVGASKEAIEAARAGIIEILSVGAGGKTTRQALKAFTKIAEVRNVNITGATITMTPEETPHA